MNTITIYGTVTNIKTHDKTTTFTLCDYKKDNTIFWSCAVFGKNKEFFDLYVDNKQRIVVSGEVTQKVKDNVTYTNVTVNTFTSTERKEKNDNGQTE